MFFLKLDIVFLWMKSIEFVTQMDQITVMYDTYCRKCRSYSSIPNFLFSFPCFELVFQVFKWDQADLDFSFCRVIDDPPHGRFLVSLLIRAFVQGQAKRRTFVLKTFTYFTHSLCEAFNRWLYSLGFWIVFHVLVWKMSALESSWNIDLWFQTIFL